MAELRLASTLESIVVRKKGDSGSGDIEEYDPNRLRQSHQQQQAGSRKTKMGGLLNAAFSLTSKICMRALEHKGIAFSMLGRRDVAIAAIDRASEIFERVDSLYSDMVRETLLKSYIFLKRCC